jgi:hypothetical protein
MAMAKGQLMMDGDAVGNGFDVADPQPFYLQLTERYLMDLTPTLNFARNVKTDCVADVR